MKFFLLILFFPFLANAQQANRFWENPAAFSTELNRAWIETQGNCSSENSVPVTIVKSRSSTLSLKDRGLTLSEMLKFIQTTPFFPQVNSLDLRNTELSADDLIQFNKLVSRMTTVTDFYFGGSSIGDKRVLMNFILINLASKIEILDLSNIKLSAEDCVMLASSLHNMKNLRILYLGNNNIGDEGFNRLMNGAFTNLPNLQILSLTANNLTDASLKRFAMFSMPLMKNLQILDLKSNNFGKNTVALLMRNSFYLPQLAVLDLGDGNGISRDSPSALVRCSTISSQSFVDPK
ncbi:MAG: hypothetical protein KGP29_00485 [Proteobacteria bacterium]|nr:hypothetical protein [Pseudomonadota bacterium]